MGFVMIGLVSCGGSGSVETTDVGATDISGETQDVAPTDGTSPPPDATGGPLTYHGSIRTLMDTHCVGCHETDGAAPFSLETYADVGPLATAIVGSVTTGSMPPWTPDPACRPMAAQRVLTASEIDQIVTWDAAGAPEGNPGSYVAPPDDIVSLDDPGLLLKPFEGYTKNPNLPDDYRCFPLDHTFASETYIVGSNVFPDQTAIVHHVLFYAVGPDDVATLAAKDDADEGPGYQCFGGPSVGNTPLIGGWVPGMQPVFFPEGAAISLEAGSQIVMQVHYNSLGVANPAPASADQTEVGLWTLPAGKKPTHLIRIDPLAYGEIQIPAGDPNSVQKMTFPYPVASTLIGVVPHMHLLGKQIGVTVKSAQGGAETCLVDIPDWDFNWQQFYWYEEEQFVNLIPGDELELTCVYDNSASNQPVVNGEQLSPKHVTWGEGTLDEMCLNYIVTMSPAPSDTLCGNLAACGMACPEGDSVCFLSCYAQSGTDCLQCVGDPLTECAKGPCLAGIVALGQCLNACDESTLVCLSGACASQYDTLYKCLEPHLESGACDSFLAPCGLSYGN